MSDSIIPDSYVACPLFLIFNQQEEEYSGTTHRVVWGKGQTCYKGRVNQEHKMRSGTLQNEALKYILLLFNDGINPASQLSWFLLLPSCKPSSIYCTEAVALEKFLCLTENKKNSWRWLCCFSDTLQILSLLWNVTRNAGSCSVTAEDVVVKPCSCSALAPNTLWLLRCSQW